MLTNARKMRTKKKVRGRSLVGPRGALERGVSSKSEAGGRKGQQKGEGERGVRRRREEAEEQRKGEATGKRMKQRYGERN